MKISVYTKNEVGLEDIGSDLIGLSSLAEPGLKCSHALEALILRILEKDFSKRPGHGPNLAPRP